MDEYYRMHFSDAFAPEIGAHLLPGSKHFCAENSIKLARYYGIVSTMRKRAAPRDQSPEEGSTRHYGVVRYLLADLVLGAGVDKFGLQFDPIGQFVASKTDPGFVAVDETRPRMLGHYCAEAIRNLLGSVVPVRGIENADAPAAAEGEGAKERIAALEIAAM
jgi:hypothetical protein